jgi:hypothetical protein
MNRRPARATGVVALLIGTATLVQPAHAAAPAPQNTCSGAFCVTVDLAASDALAPTRPTTSAAQPTNLALRFTDTSPTVGTDKSTWLAQVSAVLGSSSSKAFAVTAPAQLPLGAYVAGTAATASGCAGATDFASACPAGSGTGLVEVGGLLPTTTKTATFGITRITTGAAGALTAELTVRIDGELLPSTTTTPLSFSPATATAGPTLTMDTRPAVTPPVGYLSAELSLNTVALHLNGLVTEAAAGAVSPPAAFIRQSPLCTTVTATLAANARGTATAAGSFPQGVTDCPGSPDLVSVVPDPTNPRAFTFTMRTPTAAIAGRTASLEYVFGDGAKAVAGASTSHTYPVAGPVVALVTVLDSAGARSTALQVEIGAAAVRGKQKEGNLVIGSVTDQGTGVGLGDQDVLAYRCDTRHTPMAQCDPVGTATTRASGRYRLEIPEVKRKGFLLVAYAGTATTSSSRPARFGDARFVDVLPQPDVTLEPSRKQVRPGGTVTLIGEVRPGKKGKTVRLQGFIRGTWRAIGKTALSQQGDYALAYVVRVPGRDTVKVRAVVDGTARTLRATSPVKRITILR